MDFILCTTENHWRLLSRSMTWSKLHFQRSLAAMRGRRLLVCSREEIRWPRFHCGRDPNSPGRAETYRNETRICTRIPSIHCYPCSLHWTEHQRKSEHDVEESTPYLLEPKALKFLVPLPNSNTILADFILNSFSSVQSFSCVWLFAIPWTAACQASLSIMNSQSLFKPMSIKSLMPSIYLIFCYPLLLWPSIFPASEFFLIKSVLRIRWPKYWSFSFSISPSNEYSALISFMIDWFDLLVIQGTFKSLLQHHSSKASILHSAFFMFQLSHPYMITGKTIALTRWTFVGKVISLLFNMLSRFVIAFLPRSKCLLILWLIRIIRITVLPHR